ncbi:NAD(P)-dependent oxidoreductase [Ruminococcus sp.]|uniref:NAD-dependent epimerase/dehydratase family protein n=1 Tax=Ruminococcus sp. TaxID=41978 RepID=UPI0025EDE9B9|nr:NAD(P)-dependent oxidoreductase [Ruminococcus sp.]MBQ8967078.1 NAD(P)-dependent oxidoreductase [Ruminococcus sp.]
MSSNIMITGASGMIGQYLTSSLLHKKHRVYAVDSKSNDFVGTDDNYTFVQCDITDKNTVSAIIESNHIDVVVHLANSVDNDIDPLITDSEIKRSKVTDKYIYSSAVKAGVRAFILLSTTDVYGIQKGREPIRETIAEKGITNYAEMKMTSEKLMAKAFKKADSIPVIARVSPVYDAEHTDNLHAHVYDAKDNVGYVFGDGDYGYTFCCVFNLIDFINGIINIPQGRYEGIYNVCDSRLTTAKEIIEYEKERHRIGAVIQRSPGSEKAMLFNKGKMKNDYRYFDPTLTYNNWTFDNTRAKRIAPMRWNLGNSK